MFHGTEFSLGRQSLSWRGLQSEMGFGRLKRGVKQRRCHYRYGLRDIARACKVPYDQVKYASKAGKLHAETVEGIIAYWVSLQEKTKGANHLRGLKSSEVPSVQSSEEATTNEAWQEEDDGVGGGAR